MNDTFVGRTEMIKNNLNPSFNTPIEIQYTFERLQNLEIKIIDIDDQNKMTGNNLGHVITTLGTVVAQEPGMDFTLPVKNGKGTVTITYEETNIAARKTLSSEYVASKNCLVTQEMKKGSSYRITDEKFIIDAKGINLAKKDLFGKSDPYYYIYRLVGQNKIEIYKSEIIKKNLNPVWTTAYINVDDLESNCLAPYENYLIEVYDYDKYGSDDIIGSVKLQDLFYNITPDGKEFRGILTGKSEKHKEKGEIVLNIRFETDTKEKIVESYSVISNYNFLKNLSVYPNLKSSISFINAMRMDEISYYMCS